MLKHQLIRAMLRMITLPSPVYEPGKSPIPLPEKFLVFPRIPEDPILRSGLIKAYQQVFGEQPWEEEWPEKEVLAKLQRELTEDSFLVLMRGNEEWPVGGFSWGAIVPTRVLEARIGAALGVKPAGLEEVIRGRRIGRVVYFDEFAILRQFRSGIDPVRFLLRPGLELGYDHGVFQTLFWSTLASNIVPLALYMGYQPIVQLETEGKEIVFLFNPNFLPLLKIAQSVEWRRIARLMRSASRILGKPYKAGK